MGCLLLASFWVLAGRAARLPVNSQDSGKAVMVAVDPGHGGSDPGMIGVGGLEEKGINLAISLRLKETLEEQGYRVVMTREKDEGLYDDSAQSKKAQDMQRRIEKLRETDPALTVSIHQNSYSDPAVRGPQVFYYESSAEGKALAEAVQESLNTGLSVERPRAVKGNTSYYLLKRSPGTLVIVECGFLTNPEEAELLQEEGYQQRVAEAVAAGISAYLRRNPGKF